MWNGHLIISNFHNFHQNFQHLGSLAHVVKLNCHFDKVMLDPVTGLSHVALKGQPPQSVEDAERLLSYHIAASMQKMISTLRQLMSG